MILPASDTLQTSFHSPSNPDSSNINTTDVEAQELLPREEEKPHYLNLPLRPRRSEFEQKLFGVPANQYENLFWFDRHGETFLLDFLRTVFLVTAIYTALLVAYFGPYCYDNYTAGGCAVTLILIILPVIGNCLISPSILSLFVILTNVEMKRKKNIISQVLRTERTKKTVRILKVMNILQTIIKRHKHKQAQQEGRERAQTAREVDEEKKEKLREMFNLIDKDKSGSISVSEFRNLLNLTGHPASEHEAQLMLAEIDHDKSGDLSFEEFVSFMSSHLEEELDANNQNKTPEQIHKEIEELVHHVFEIYDVDQSGSLTIDEFRGMLTAFGQAVSYHDAQEIIKELDHDRSGEIEPEEFAELLKKYL